MKSWLRPAVLILCLLSGGVRADEPAASTDAQPANSSLDAVLFYQLLLGELNVRQGSPGAGFSLILDAARKTRDPALFQRAVDIALQARSGDAALQAAQTWKRELPEAREPSRYTLQILLALNRIEDAGQALANSIDELPEDEKQGAITSIPRVFARVTDKALAARVVEKALSHSLTQKKLQATAWTTIGRMHREAQHWPQAIDAAIKGRASDREAPGPLILGMSLLPTGSVEIQQMLDEAMQSTSVSPDLRLGYARNLIALQATDAGLAQLQRLTQEHPNFAPGWLLLGMLQVDLNQVAQARQSLARHVNLVKDSSDPEQQAGLTEALMTLSQLAQQQGDLAQAGRWLNQIPASADPVRLAIRRAELLDQQGRTEEGRLVLAQAQPVTAQQGQRKILALSQWLREHQQAAQALDLLAPALSQEPEDSELLTEQSLVLEKLKRHEDMESVLRQLMRTRPQDPHAYNALGYSLADRGIRLEEARSLIAKAVELAPLDPFIQDSLGWVEFRLGNAAEAARILRAAWTARPDPEIAAHLGEVLWTQGQQSDAAAVWREGLMLKANNETLQKTIKRLGFKP
jgi:tetratricopeptide (TPR) repeat protein